MLEKSREPKARGKQDGIVLACHIRIIVEGHFEKTIEERMTLVKGGLMTERSRNIASDTGVMGTSELYLPRVYWALVRSKVEGIVSL